MSQESPPAEKRPANRDRPGLREIGPAWISAGAALIAALAALAGFFAGQKSTAGNSPGPHQSTELASGQPASRPAVTASATDAGAVLASPTSVTLSSGFGVTFGPKPLQPQAGHGDLVFNLGGGEAIIFGNGQLSVFKGSTPTYHACATDQLYLESEINSYPTGSVYCFVGHGVVAAITITSSDTDSTDSINYVTFNTTVWKNS
jgi:hypothetical protein